MLLNQQLHPRYAWLHEPSWHIHGDCLHIITSRQTDFWQETHYHFRRDNGHCLLTPVKGDFSMTVRTRFAPRGQYDQCGLVLRLDAENWIKASVEYESPNHARLGSVVTNLGYSDWATIDIAGSVDTMWYRMQTRGSDVLIEYAENGRHWHQLRIAHLHRPFTSLLAGIYACSPQDSSFEARFDQFHLGESNW